MDFTVYGSASREWQAYVAKNGTPITTPIAKLPPEQIQEMTNKGREAVSAERMKVEGLDVKVNIETVEIPTRDRNRIPVRIYRPMSKLAVEANPQNSRLFPIYLFYHGGGFIYGTATSEDATCSAIVASLSIIVISVCYRHTPQVRYPVPYFDAFDSFEWVIANLDSIGGDPGKVMVGGVSAGASLAVSATMRSLGKQTPKSTYRGVKGQVLCIPWLFVHPEMLPEELTPTMINSSRWQCSTAPIVSQTELEFFMNQLDMGTSKSDDGMEMGGILVTDEKLSEMPKTAFMIAGMDPLRDDGLLYAQNLHRKGVPVKVNIFPGLPHGFRRFPQLPSSWRWDDLIIENLKWLLEDDESRKTGQQLHIHTEAPGLDF